MKTSEMPANRLTKVLPTQAYKCFLAHLNLYSISYMVNKRGVTGKEHVNREGGNC
jgi:hypothetical protein